MPDIDLKKFLLAFSDTLFEFAEEQDEDEGDIPFNLRKRIEQDIAVSIEMAIEKLERRNAKPDTPEAA